MPALGLLAEANLGSLYRDMCRYISPYEGFNL